MKKNKIVKFIALSFACLSLIVASYGIYSLKKNDIDHHVGASENLIAATEIIKDIPLCENKEIEEEHITISHMVAIDGRFNTNLHKFYYKYDNKYLVDLTIYEDTYYAKYNNIACAWHASDEEFIKDIEWLNNLKFRMSFDSVDGKNHSTFGMDIGCLNNRFTLTIDSPLDITNNQIVLPYLEFVFNAHIFDIKDYSMEVHFEDILEAKGLWYDIVHTVVEFFYPIASVMATGYLLALNTFFDFPYNNVGDFQNDLNKVTGAQVTNKKIGNISLFVALPIFFLTLIVLLAPFIFSRNHKVEESVVTNRPLKSNNRKNRIKLAANDISQKTLSFSGNTLKGIVIAAVSLSMIAANVVLALNLKPNVPSTIFTTTNIINIVGKNLLIVGLMSLAFFGCIYISKKDKHTTKQLLTSVFIASIFCYLLNILCYQYFIPGYGDSYLIITSFLQTMPDNIFIPLFLGLLAYYCSISQNHSFGSVKELIFIVATGILILSCFIVPVSDYMSKSYYLTALFSPNLSIANFFIASYLIVSRFANILFHKRHEEMSYDDYLNSPSYIKNNKIIATTIISLLFIIDLICRFYAPDNIFNFGYNHGIVLLIPLIWLYKTKPGQKGINTHLLAICLIALIILSSVAIFGQLSYASLNLIKEI